MVVFIHNITWIWNFHYGEINSNSFLFFFLIFYLCVFDFSIFFRIYFGKFSVFRSLITLCKFRLIKLFIMVICCSVSVVSLFRPHFFHPSLCAFHFCQKCIISKFIFNSSFQRTIWNLPFIFFDCWWLFCSFDFLVLVSSLFLIFFINLKWNLNSLKFKLKLSCLNWIVYFWCPSVNIWITTATFKVYLKFRLTSNCFFSEGHYEVKA